MKKTRIIATIGPACENIHSLKAMFKAGVNVCRLNFSFGTLEEHMKKIMLIRQAGNELNQTIVHQCVQNGLITDWFLFAPDRMRIALPLIITDEEIKEVCDTILKSINEIIK